MSRGLALFCSVVGWRAEIGVATGSHQSRTRRWWAEERSARDDSRGPSPSHASRRAEVAPGTFYGMYLAFFDAASTGRKPEP